MKLNLFLAATILISASEACKCGGNVDATRACCRSVGGIPTDDDCPADTISERLSNFASCCTSLGAHSDCRCSFGCAKHELEVARKAQGLQPLNDTEIIAALASYEG